MTHESLLDAISAGLEDAEDAIRAHPPETIAVYHQTTVLLRMGVALAPETERSIAMDLSHDQLSLIYRYMNAMAFMAAWYARHGDRARQRRTAATTSLVVGAALHTQPEVVFRKFFEFEVAANSALTEAGIGAHPAYYFSKRLLIVLLFAAPALFIAGSVCWGAP